MDFDNLEFDWDTSVCVLENGPDNCSACEG